VGWIQLAQDIVQLGKGGRCEHGHESSGSITPPSLLTSYILKLTKGPASQTCYLVMYHRRGDKVKVKLSLCLTKHHAMKTHWGVEV
jgi:hypothetical protein